MLELDVTHLDSQCAQFLHKITFDRILEPLKFGKRIALLIEGVVKYGPRVFNSRS